MSDLAAEMAAVLDALETPVATRAAPVAPPPKRARESAPGSETGEVVEAEAVEPAPAGAEVEQGGARAPTHGKTPVPERVQQSEEPRARLSVPEQTPRPRRRGRPPKPSGPPRGTTAALPAEIVETLRLHRMAEAARGRRFVLNEWVIEAICELPSSIPALSKLVDEFFEELNIGLVARDPGWKPTAALPLRVSESADLALDTARYELYRRDGTKLDRQDLIGVAILHRLRGERSS